MVSEGLAANLKYILKRVKAKKDAPRWLVDQLQTSVDRASVLPFELAARCEDAKEGDAP